MSNVGVLAAVVNVIVLITVTIVDRIIELVVRNFTAARLRKERRAPVVHDSDTWLPNIPRSMVKYRKHPAILFTLLLAFFLITTEIITELGVDVSNTCSAEKKSAQVITQGDSSNSSSEVQLGISAFFLQNTHFLDGELKRVPSGLPRIIKGTECFPCMKSKQYPDIMNGCSIENEKVYGPGQLSITLLTMMGPFGTITDKMTEIGGSGRIFKGRGDLTYNGFHWSAFLFDTSVDDNLIYLEYSNQEHLSSLVNSARENENMPTHGLIESNVTVKRIKCSINHLSVTKLRNAISIYRTIQLENTINPAVFVPKQQSFQNLTTADVYRAGLCLKITDDDMTIGEYYEYTTCGTYNWIFVLPIVICVGCIFLLFFLSWTLQREFEPRVPYNSRSWFRQSRGNTTSKRGRLSRSSSRSGYFDTIFDEMVVIEGEGGSSAKLGLRSRDGNIAPFTTLSNRVVFTNDYNSNVQIVNELESLGDVVLTTEVEVPPQPNYQGEMAKASDEHVGARG